MLPHLHFYFFTSVVGNGHHACLEGLCSVDLLFIIIIIILVQLIVKVRIIVTKITSAFCHRNIYPMYVLF